MSPDECISVALGFNANFGVVAYRGERSFSVDILDEIGSEGAGDADVIRIAFEIRDPESWRPACDPGDGCRLRRIFRPRPRAWPEKSRAGRGPIPAMVPRQALYRLVVGHRNGWHSPLHLDLNDLEARSNDATGARRARP